MPVRFSTTLANANSSRTRMRPHISGFRGVGFYGGATDTMFTFASDNFIQSRGVRGDDIYEIDIIQPRMPIK